MIRHSQQVHLSPSDILVIGLVGGREEDLFAMHYKNPIGHYKQRHPTCVRRLEKKINCYSK